MSQEAKLEKLGKIEQTIAEQEKLLESLVDKFECLAIKIRPCLHEKEVNPVQVSTDSEKETPVPSELRVRLRKNNHILINMLDETDYLIKACEL